MKNKEKLQITTFAYNEIISTVGSSPAESGGLLFGNRTDWIITRFLFDANAKTTSASYTFNIGYLNPMIKKFWEEEKLELLGFFHSHPHSYGRLSEPDKKYFQSQFENIEVDYFLTPIIFPARDGIYEFFPFVYHKNGTIETAKLEVLPDDYQEFFKQKVVEKEVVRTEKIIEPKIIHVEPKIHHVEPKIVEVEKHTIEKIVEKSDRPLEVQVHFAKPIEVKVEVEVQMPKKEKPNSRNWELTLAVILLGMLLLFVVFIPPVLSFFMNLFQFISYVTN